MNSSGNTPQPQRGLLRLASEIAKPYRPGQQRRVRSAGAIRVTSVEHLTLAQVSHEQARALGHKGTAALKRAWITSRDAAWLLDADRSDADVLRRYDERWGRRAAVLVRYVAAGRPRLLADVRRGYGDYTTSPGRTIDPDAECIDQATQERYSKDALAFCIGRQINRAKEQAAKRDARARQFRDAA